LLALVLIGHALRERMSELALYAGACFNLTVTLAYLLAVSRHGTIDGVDLVRLVQLNAITCGVYLLPWLATRRRWHAKLSQVNQRFGGFLLKFQLSIAVALNALLVVSGLIVVTLMSKEAGPGTIAIGSYLGWLSLLAVIVAAFSMSLIRTIRLKATTLGALLLSAGCLIAVQLSSLGGDAGLHALTVCVAATAWLLFIAAELTLDRCKEAPFPINLARHVFDLDHNWLPRARTLATIAGVFVLVLSIRNLANPEANRWWSVAPLLVMTLLAATFSWRTKMRCYIYAAGLLFYISVWWLLVVLEKHANGIEFPLDVVIANSLAGLVWLWLDLRARRSEGAIGYYFSFHNISAIFLLGLLALLVICHFALDLGAYTWAAMPGVTWLSFLSVTTLIIACLFDRYAKYAVAALYILGLLACAIVLAELDLTPTRFAWSATVILSAYSLCVALVWHWRRRILDFATRL